MAEFLGSVSVLEELLQEVALEEEYILAVLGLKMILKEFIILKFARLPITGSATAGLFLNQISD